MSRGVENQGVGVRAAGSSPVHPAGCNGSESQGDSASGRAGASQEGAKRCTEGAPTPLNADPGVNIDPPLNTGGSGVASAEGAIAVCGDAIAWRGTSRAIARCALPFGHASLHEGADLVEHPGRFPALRWSDSGKQLRDDVVRIGAAASAEGASAPCTCAFPRLMCPDCGNGACSACVNASQTNAPAVCGARGEGGSVCDLPKFHAAYPHQDTRTGHAWTLNAARPPAPHISEAPTSREATSLPRPSDERDLAQARAALARILEIFASGSFRTTDVVDVAREGLGAFRPRRTLEGDLSEVLNRHGEDSRCGVADTELAQAIVKYLRAAYTHQSRAAVPSHIEPEKAGPIAGDTIFLRGDRSERGAPAVATALGKRHGEEWARRTASWTTLARDHLGHEAAQLFGAALRSMKTMVSRHDGELVAAAFEDARGPEPVLGAAYEDERGRLYTLDRDPGGKARIVVSTHSDGTRHYEHELVWRDRRHRLVRMPSGGAA